MADGYDDDEDDDDEEQSSVDLGDSGGEGAYAQYAPLPPNEFARFAAPPADNEFTRFRPPVSGQAPNYFDRYDAPPPPAADPWAEFRPQPMSQADYTQLYGGSQAPQDIPTISQADYMRLYGGQPQTPQPTQAEGELATGVREFAHNIVPGAAAVGAGVLAAPLGLVGSLPAAVGTFWATRKLQDEGLKTLGIDDSTQLALNAATNPKSALAGSLASGLPFFGAGAATVGTRVLGAGIGAGLEAGSEYLQGSDFDPTRILTSGAAGAVLTRPTGLTRSIESRVAATPLAQSIASRVDAALGRTPVAAPTDTTVGAESTTPPAQDLTSTLRSMADDLRQNGHNDHAADVDSVASHVERGAYGDWTTQPPAALRAAAASRRASGQEDPAAVLSILADAGDRMRAQAAISTAGGRPGALTAAGTAEAQIAPAQENVSGREIGVGSETVYPKTPRDAGLPPTAIDTGIMAPDKQAALENAVRPAAAVAPPEAQNAPTAPLRAPGVPVETPIPVGQHQYKADDGRVWRINDEGKREWLTELSNGDYDWRTNVGVKDTYAQFPSKESADYFVKTVMSEAPPSPPPGLTIPTALRAAAAEFRVNGDVIRSGLYNSTADAFERTPTNEVDPVELRNRAAQARAQGMRGRADQYQRAATAMDMAQARQAQTPPAAPVAPERPVTPVAPVAPVAPVPPGPAAVRQRQMAAQAQQNVLRGPVPGAPPPGGGPPRPPGAPPPPQGPPGGPPPRATAPAPTPPSTPPPPLPAGQQLNAAGSRIWNAVKNLLAPQTRGPQARQVADMIRKTYGNATQLMEQTKAILAKHQDTINAMAPNDLRALVNKAQGGTAYPNWQPNAAQQAALTDIKNVTDAWAAKLGTLSRAQQQQWIDQYLPGMYKNPGVNQQFFASRGVGGAGSLKQKFFPDYETARAAGLEPFTDNPLEMLDLYGQKMRNFIGRQEALETGLKSGLFIEPARRPQAIGAAGSPQPYIKTSLPPDYVESKTSPGIFMPEETVHAWDNFHMTGMRGNGLYDAAREMNAAWTNLELSLNAYHFFTMSNESMIADVAMGLEKIAGGNVMGGLGRIARAPIAPYQRYQQGKAVQEAYLDRANTDPVMKSLVDAGLRPIGRSNALDSNMASRTFLNSLKGLPQQIEQAIKESRQDWLNSKGDVLAQIKYPFRLAGRVIATVSHPLFSVYIPRLKAGAAYAQMEHWRDMNPNKIGTPDEGVAARKILDSLDNRFGEMVTDHLFMNKMVQDMGVAGLRSFSWLMGTLKEIGGGTYSAARGVAQAARTGDLSRLNMLDPASPHYDPRVAYIVAMPMTIAATSAIYQYLMGSHDAPADWRDLYAPRTGGTVKSVGQVVPEHVLFPGYHKDVHGWLSDPLVEAYNKLGGVWSTAIEEARGRGTPALGSPPFIRPDATFTQNIADRMSYAFGKMGPIGIKAYVKGQKDGSQIPDWMAAAGFHAPGADILNPKGLAKLKETQAKTEWKKMATQANRDARSRGQPIPYPAN